MSSPEDAQALLEQFEKEGREDLANGVVRVDHTCHQCPFHRWVHPFERVPSTGNPKIECIHPATLYEDPPRVIKIGRWAHVPNNCPLREASMTIELKDPNARWRGPGEEGDGYDGS